MKDFMELRAEERLSLCHRVSNELHPKRDPDARAARARTYFDMLHQTYYAGMTDALLADRLAFIESLNEAMRNAK